MAQFQVVAIGETTGTRFAVREPWDSFLRAAAHLGACRAAFPESTYEIDMTRADGSVKRNVQPEDLGYPESEYVESLEFGASFSGWRALTPARECLCPGDCNCRHQGAPWHRTNYCGCKAHAA